MKIVNAPASDQMRAAELIIGNNRGRNMLIATAMSCSVGNKVRRRQYASQRQQDVTDDEQ